MKVESKQQVIEIIRDNLDQFAKLGVSRVGLFGSFVREDFTPESDVDLLVALSNHSWSNFCNLIDFAEQLFGRKVDVITENSINPINGKEICREVEYVHRTHTTPQSHPDRDKISDQHIPASTNSKTISIR